MKYAFNLLTLLIVALTLGSCPEKSSANTAFDKEVYTLQYASGLSIVGCNSQHSTLSRVHNPWQGADSITVAYFA